MVRDRFVGVMTMVHPEAGFFNESLLTFFQVIADQSGIAILNARLYAESQRQAHVMTALAETAATITGSLNTEDVLLRIMEQTSQALSAQAVSLALLDPSGSSLYIRAATGWRNKVTRAKIRLGQGVAGWVAKEGRGAIINDVNRDSRFDNETNDRTGLRTSAIACAPLRYRGQVIGVLEALNTITNGSFDSDALVVLSGIGSLAGTAVRHAQLFERLQAAHQSYRELFEASIDPILITDGQGSIKEVNRPAMLISDFGKDDLLRFSIGQLHTADATLLGERFENLRSGEPISYESRLRTQSGHEVPIRAYVRQVIIEGSPHIQWILRDITERKNLDNMREDLMSMIYHDLRSPLANVVSSLDTLESMLPEEDPTLLSLLAIAMRSVERIQRLTNSLLDINRLEAGQPLGQQQPNDIGLIINDASQLIRPVAESKDQSITADLPSDLPFVNIDGEMIRRVITNLIENAVKYCPAGCHVVVGAKNADQMVEVWVQDDGPGIPSSEHERIFDKFTRLTSREKPKGLGLGLAYCKLAIQAHGGRIWVESEPKHGSRFAFTLPIVQELPNL
jgi:PAS domain S-box-containing protein